MHALVKKIFCRSVKTKITKTENATTTTTLHFQQASVNKNKQDILPFTKRDYNFYPVT